MFQKTRITSR